MKLHKNQAGSLNPIIIVVIVIVIAVLGFAGYKVYTNNKDKKASSSGQSAQVDKATAEALDQECMKTYNDKDFCKFASSWEVGKVYKTSFKSTAADGKTSVMTIEVDGDNSSSVISEDGKETGAYITLNKNTYYKDYEASVWYKIPQSTTGTDSTQTEQSQSPSQKLDFKTEDGKPNTVTIKKIGKEACGNNTCYKYQIIDTSDADTLESFIWFNDNDFKMARMSTKQKDGSSWDGTFEYPSSVKITEPYPVQDMPTFDPSSLTAPAGSEQ